jgi:hypothetical protein
MSWWTDSGACERKSQNWSALRADEHELVADRYRTHSFKCVCGSRFWVWMKCGNLAGSRTKKMGVLLNCGDRVSVTAVSGTLQTDDPIPVPLCCTDLDRESARVASRVGGTTLTADGREAGGDPSGGADLFKELGARQVADVVGNGEGAVGTRPFGVDDPL